MNSIFQHNIICHLFSMTTQCMWKCQELLQEMPRLNMRSFLEPHSYHQNFYYIITFAKIVHHSKMRTFINAKCKYETRGSSIHYPASRGPSIFLDKSEIFPTYLGRSKGICSQGIYIYIYTDWFKFSESEVSASRWHSLVQILFKDISKTVMTQVM